MCVDFGGSSSESTQYALEPF